MAFINLFETGMEAEEISAQKMLICAQTIPYVNYIFWSYDRVIKFIYLIIVLIMTTWNYKFFTTNYES